MTEDFQKAYQDPSEDQPDLDIEVMTFDDGEFDDRMFNQAEVEVEAEAEAVVAEETVEDKNALASSSVEVKKEEVIETESPPQQIA